MGLRQISPPLVEPLSLKEAKAHLRVDHDVDDVDIGSYITTARRWIEAETRLSLVCTTFELTLDKMPLDDAGDLVALPRYPLVEVELVEYIDAADGSTQTWDSDEYQVVTAFRPGTLTPTWDSSWPSARCQPNGVMISFVAGMGASISFNKTDNTIAISGRTVLDGERVNLVSDGNLPSGVTPNRTYFVVSASGGGTACKLSLTSGGSEIDLSGSEEGQHFLGNDFSDWELARQAIRLMIGHLYENREAVGFRAQNAADRERAPDELPLGWARLVELLRSGDDFVVYE